MTSDIQQYTLNSSATMSGPGLHTGEDCSITIHPADPGSGIVFVTERGEISAHVKNVCDTRRGTNLACGEASVRTVEHLLAALAGMRVDNARIEVSGPEIPIGDGSALRFVELIERAGMEGQGVPCRSLKLPSPVWVNDSDKYLFAVPSDIFYARSLILFPHPMIGEQAVSFAVTPEIFKREIAPARTFCTYEEIEPLISQGLGRGGREDNVVVAYNDHYSIPLRYADEFVRHKLLDLIGDMSLVGGRIKADITAIKGSHSLDASLADKMVRILASTSQGG